LNTPGPTVELVIVYIALLVFVFTSLLAIGPAVASELAAKNGKSGGLLRFQEIPAAGARGWWLFAAVSIALVASLWVKFRRGRVVALLVAVVGAGAIAAASMGVPTSGASAFRWILAVLLLAGSV